jgi:hypothetical protein
MIKEQSELETQVSHLPGEIARLRKLVITCFGVLGVLLVMGFADRELPMMIAGFGAAVWAFGYLCVTVGTSLHRFFRRRKHNVE